MDGQCRALWRSWSIAITAVRELSESALLTRRHTAAAQDQVARRDLPAVIRFDGLVGRGTGSGAFGVVFPDESSLPGSLSLSESSCEWVACTSRSRSAGISRLHLYDGRVQALLNINAWEVAEHLLERLPYRF